MAFALFLHFPLLLFLLLRCRFFSPLSTFAIPRHLRTLGENCDKMALLCEPTLQCVSEFDKWTCQNVSALPLATQMPIGRCSRVKCSPVVFPADCPHDTVPVLLQSVEVEASLGGEELHECCPSLVKCQCDPKKCVIPSCPEGNERLLVQLGTEKPGECCDRFECRRMECEDVRCPESVDTLDLYSADGVSCPSDSYRPAPYVPPGACCPIISQCTCKLGICEPAKQCSDDEVLVVRQRGGGEPGKCCDEFECRPANESDRSAEGCRHGDRFFTPGEKWQNAPCQECQCGSGGISKCRRMECPNIVQGCTWIGILPGECCPVCLGCRDENGITYEHGEHWERDECTNCSCLEFRWQCQKFICKTDCENPRRVPGECCPICDAPSEIKSPSSLGCPSLRHCPLRCEFGLVQNRSFGCFECECAEMKRTKDGEMATKCEPLTEQNCARLCAHGYLRDQNGCSICRCAHCPPLDDRCGKLCVFGFESNSVGCPICKCRSAESAANVLASADGSVMPPYHTVPFGSSIHHPSHAQSLHCLSGVKERDIGEWWTESECWHCFCQHGKEFCSLIVCPPRPDHCLAEHWTRSSERQCCPSCLSAVSSSPQNASFPSLPPQIEQRHFFHVCHSPGTGQLFVDGETWHLNGCVACTCRMGHVLCSWNDGRQCPPSPCDRPLLHLSADQCCPRCSPAQIDEQQPVQPPSEMVERLLAIGDKRQHNICVDAQNGTIYGPGDEWRRNVCQSCRCLSDGQVQCFAEQCSAQLTSSGNCSSDRMLFLKDRCCPICSDAFLAIPTPALCNYNGTVFSRGEKFRDGPCRNCTCIDGGAIQCTEMHCPNCGNEENSTEIANRDECCTSCKADSPIVIYSSFERAIEDRITFVGEEKDKRLTNSRAELHFWLVVPISSLVLVTLLILFATFVLAARKCRMGTMIKKVAGGKLSDNFNVPKPTNAKRGHAVADKESGEVGTSLLDTSDATRTA